MNEQREVAGVVTLMQEDRFRIETPDGVGMLFTLGMHANRKTADLARLVGSGRPVRVVYRGEPDLGAVATRVDEIG